ncbi:MAG: hypothetical protein CMI71_00275 [Candidatus Pelagibacter sp.]|nr:hypothetical protein [Candidatus Pelagibacter sp.]|tara:strand:+ start:1210 stop:1731 length:522 start_codon:yes stop_codon:yes gene_type:complete
MKLGKAKFLIHFFLIFTIGFSLKLYSEEKINSVPLINLEDLKPSYEEVDEEEKINSSIQDYQLKEKEIKRKDPLNVIVNMRGLDKITAKTSEISIKIGETKKFGLLEIKAITCGKVESLDDSGETAYIQIKDISDNKNEKVFVFNGWTFSSNPSFKPIDHAIYDLWLVGCENV